MGTDVSMGQSGQQREEHKVRQKRVLFKLSKVSASKLSVKSLTSGSYSGSEMAPIPERLIEKIK